MRKDISMDQECFKVVAVSPNAIQIEIGDIDMFKKEHVSFSLGSHLRITDDKGDSIIAIVRSYHVKDPILPAVDETGTVPEPDQLHFIIDAQPLGFVDAMGKFSRGGQQLSIPPTDVAIASTKLLQDIYSRVEPAKALSFASLPKNKEVRTLVDGDRFFSKHLAVLGSTGSGKSCTVAKILQEGICPSAGQQKKGLLNNSHVIIFDLHGEYARAFKSKSYHICSIGIDELRLPYWLMNSEELQEFFLDTDAHDHNQRNILKLAIVENKKRTNPDVDEKYVTYDSPLPFSISEVLQYIQNRNNEKAIENKIAWEKGGEQHTLEKHGRELFEGAVEFGKGKITNTLNSKFINFLSRLENKVSDKRLQFMLDETRSLDITLEDTIRQFIGYAHKDDNRANATIVDLSGIPFEVLSIVVSLINRLVFDFCYHYKNMKPGDKEVPILIVLEEAHNYIPRSELARYHSVRKSVERIAKEGRKYGLSLMIVSQRPSEISETIFSQCNNFVVMRLTNPTDQTYVTKLLPDSVSAITESLPSLEQRDALLIGDAIVMPTIVQIDEIADTPDSKDINVHTEWKKDWVKIQFENLIESITGEERSK